MNNTIVTSEEPISWLLPSTVAYPLLFYCIILFGYIIQTYLLAYLYSIYSTNTKENDVKTWKTQSKNTKHLGQLWGYPLFSNKPNRGKYHKLFTTLNHQISCIFSATVAYLCVTGNSKMVFDSVSDYGVLQILIDVWIAVTYENVVEYYWHIMNHSKYLYPTFHKYHHFYKSPEPWDDMYIHPLEASGYYCILFGAPFLFRIHFYAFVIYMAIMGFCGVLDHSGVKLSVPGFYNTEDHDAHHSKFEVNYGFPFPFMDILHGTFSGDYLGRSFTVKNIKRN